MLRTPSWRREPGQFVSQPWPANPDTEAPLHDERITASNSTSGMSLMERGHVVITVAKKSEDALQLVIEFSFHSRAIEDAGHEVLWLACCRSATIFERDKNIERKLSSLGSTLHVYIKEEYWDVVSRDVVLKREHSWMRNCLRLHFDGDHDVRKECAQRFSSALMHHILRGVHFAGISLEIEVWQSMCEVTSDNTHACPNHRRQFFLKLSSRSSPPWNWWLNRQWRCSWSILSSLSVARRGPSGDPNAVEFLCLLRVRVAARRSPSGDPSCVIFQRTGVWTLLTSSPSPQVMSPTPTTSTRPQSSPTCSSWTRRRSSPTKSLLRTPTTITLYSRICSTKHIERKPITLNEKTCLSVCRRRQCPTERGDLLGTERGHLLSKVARKHRLGLCSTNKKEQILAE